MSDDNSQDKDKELYSVLVEWLREDTSKKRQEREKDAANAASGKNGFWQWWKEFGSSFGTLVTVLSVVIGGLWTLNVYLTQQRLDSEARKQALITQYATDLSDPNKRAASAYALAVLAKDDAIPILLAQIQDVARSEPDSKYRDSLVQAFITIGESSLPSIVDLNRQANGDSDSPKTGVISVTQPIILHFLLQKTTANLNGINLKNVSVSYRDIGKSNLRGSHITSSSFCHVNLSKSDLAYTSFANTSFQGSLVGTMISDTFFTYADFTGTDFSRAIGTNPDFSYAQLQSTRMFAAQFDEADFSNANLRRVDLTEAEVTHTAFDGAILHNAKLISATLTHSSFWGTDLESADFSNADLRSVDFSFTDSWPRIPDGVVITSTQPITQGVGAWVLGANFANARNLNDNAKRYLCRMGAQNIPGGCKDIPTEPFIVGIKPRGDSGFVATGCF